MAPKYNDATLLFSPSSITTTMFSSIASFLPSALHIGPSSEPSRPPQFSQDDPVSDDDALESNTQLPEPRPAKQKSSSRSREKTANESFIIVRPPPSKSNHPLNLQVQLVPPNAKPPNGVGSQSSTSTPTTAESEISLARTSSTRSDASYTNYCSSTSSFASVSSSNISTRRAIVPLYNLQAHNVMTNVIVDAGTDAKIAKFQKRGMVLVDLASLEPVEVWGDSPTSAKRASLQLSIDDSQGGARKSLASKPLSSRTHTPERNLAAAPSTNSLNSTRQSHLHAQPPTSRPIPSTLSVDLSDAEVATTPTASNSLPAPPVKRNIFGKLFQSNSNKRTSLTSPASPSFSPKQDTTPKPTVEANRAGPSTPTNDRGHNRNISLTTFSPLKSPFRAKNKSTVNTNSPSSSSLDVNAHPDNTNIGLGANGNSKSGLYAPSPAMSVSSLAVTTESIESNNIYHTAAANTNHQLTHTTSHLHQTISHQTGSGVATAPVIETKLQQLQSRPPVLGIQPTYVAALGSNLSGSSGIKKMKALLYVWLVRRWLKRSRSEEDIFNPLGSGGGFLRLGTKGKDKDGGPGSSEPGAGVEVRFEWKRAKVKRSGSSRRGRVNKRNEDDEKAIRRRSTPTVGDWDPDQDEGGHTEREKSRESGKKQQTRGSRLTTVGSNNSLRSGEGKKHQRRPMSAVVSGADQVESTDDGEETDPEDSDTPWVCTLKVRRTGPSAAGNLDVVRVKVGTLSPTPHHPKVVAMLKVPFPLPDVEIDHLRLRKRTTFAAQGNVNEMGEVGLPVVRDYERGSTTPTPATENQEDYQGVLLTAEDIKDIVCSTSFWLIVREGIGGVGRVNRKGDGWRIRA